MSKRDKWQIDHAQDVFDWHTLKSVFGVHVSNTCISNVCGEL